MAHWIDLTTFEDKRGKLTILEDFQLFPIKRIYYIYQAQGERGNHRHHKTIQGLICLSGSCEIVVNNGMTQETFLLNDPTRILVLQPEDWHVMRAFTQGAVLLVLASESYRPEDYIYEPY